MMFAWVSMLESTVDRFLRCFRPVPVSREALARISRAVNDSSQTTCSSQILILYKPADGDWRQNASSKLTSNDFAQRFPRALGQFFLPEVYFQLMKNELRWPAAVCRCLRDQEVEERKWREANSSVIFFLAPRRFSLLLQKSIDFERIASRSKLHVIFVPEPRARLITSLACMFFEK